MLRRRRGWSGRRGCIATQECRAEQRAEQRAAAITDRLYAEQAQSSPPVQRHAELDCEQRVGAASPYIKAIRQKKEPATDR